MPRKRQKIIRENFLTINGITFSFWMTDHIDHDNPEFTEDEVLTKICKRISAGYQEVIPFWDRLPDKGQNKLLMAPDQGARKFPILPDDPDGLFQCLDIESRKKKFSNWLIFERNGNHIKVTHFGPFGSATDEEFKDTQEKTDRSLAIKREMLEQLKSPDNKMTKKEQEEREEHIKEDIRVHYLSIVQYVESKLQSKKKELEDLIYRVYDKEEDREAAKELAGKLAAQTGKVLLKTMLAIVMVELAEQATKKVAAKIAAKVAAKAAAKAGLKGGGKAAAKGSGKAVAKAFPFLGAAVGVGYGVWRLCHGDVTGAGLEVVTGAASCIPGAGMLASVAIDATLIGKDIYEAKAEKDQHAEELQKRVRQIEVEMKALGEEYNRAKEDYEFVKEVLEDPGFGIGKLQHEISILEKISAALCAIAHDNIYYKMRRKKRFLSDGLIFNVLQQMERDARKGTNNTDLLVELKKIASDKGFMISDNQGGGNCMFHAVSEQLNLVKGIQISHQDLRHKVVNYLKNNPKLPDRTELFNFVDGYLSWDSYLTNMGVDGTWGDHVILHGVANCFGTCIHVISSQSHHNNVIINPERDVTNSNRLVLGHLHELHYVSLIPRTLSGAGRQKGNRKEDREEKRQKGKRKEDRKEKRQEGKRKEDRKEKRQEGKRKEDRKEKQQEGKREEDREEKRKERKRKEDRKEKRQEQERKEDRTEKRQEGETKEGRKEKGKEAESKESKKKKGQNGEIKEGRKEKRKAESKEGRTEKTTKKLKLDEGVVQENDEGKEGSSLNRRKRRRQKENERKKQQPKS